MLQTTIGIHEDAVCIISLFIRNISVRAYYNAMLVQRINFVDMCVYICVCVCVCVCVCEVSLHTNHQEHHAIHSHRGVTGRERHPANQQEKKEKQIISTFSKEWEGS